MQLHDGAGDPLSRFLAFLQPLSPAKRGWTPPDGGQELFIGRDGARHSAAAAFAGERVITGGDDAAAEADHRVLPPAA